MTDTKFLRPRREGLPRHALEVLSIAFEDGSRLAHRYVKDGGNLSPPLSWTALSEAVTTAVVCEDPDAPREEPFTHWVIFNIPADRHRLPEGVSKDAAPPDVPGATQGVNDFGRIGYDGPAPPPGHGIHRYFFRVYTLDVELPLREGATKRACRDAMRGHVLAEGRIIGTYSR
jgi:Raf kinase inhibitor-like YbhB/YbcL family protein